MATMTSALLAGLLSILPVTARPGASTADPPVPVPSAEHAGRPEASSQPRLAVEILEFPELIDAARPASPPAETSRPRLLPRLGEDKPAAPAPSGRRVPIKVHVPATGGPYPLIVVSHGAGGDWDSHFGQAQDLAAHGYAVLCVEHVGSNREKLTKGLRPLKNVDAMIRDADEVLTRPKDVSFAIDRAAEWNATHARLKGRLDVAHVGVMGHSFGAFTTMVACGMRPALDWLTPRVGPGKGLGPDLRDARVACGVALSPQGVGEPFFVRESFASLRAPLLGISGTKDDQQAGQPAASRKDAFALWPKGENRFVWLANARHLDFTSAAGSGGRSLPSASRDDVQPVARAATLAFFDIHLKSSAAAAKTLTPEGLKPSLRGVVTSVEVLTK